MPRGAAWWRHQQPEEGSHHATRPNPARRRRPDRGRRRRLAARRRRLLRRRRLRQARRHPGGAQPTQAEPQAAPLDPAPEDPASPPATGQAAPKPRILGFGSEPVYPREGGFWQLPPGPGQAYLITDAQYATRVEFLLTPTGTGTAAQAISIGVDRDGSNGYTAVWSYGDQPLLAHLVVRATGPGGTTDKIVGVYHPEQQQS